MKNPVITINRQDKTFAIFDNHFDLIHDFENYTDEETALAKAKSLVAKKTDVEPEIEYTVITSIKFS